MKTVMAAYVSGMSTSWNLNLFSGPKCDIKCGDCGNCFSERLPLMDRPKIQCPACKTLNIIPVEYK